tara:strand:+ start:2242 stop:2886 length:645 start_codon:yes stop_codon:yes gene_type:complete
MIAILPIRSGSKGIPHKNIKLFNEKPLIWWTLNTLENSNVDKIIVASDDQHYLKIVEDFNFTKVNLFKRTQECSTDTATSESVLLEVISVLNLNDDILFVQTTSPLTTSKDFNKGIELYKEYDSVLSGVKQQRFIWGKEGNSLNYDYKNRPRRQDWEGYFVENGAFYINSSNNILKHKNRLSGNIGLCEMDEFHYYEIDSMQDWAILENLQKYI